MDATDRPRVVIIGGGFGGLAAAKALRKAPVDVLLIDKRNHHLFQPLLYQVATAGLSAPDIAAPIRQLLRHQDNATVLLDRVDGIDTTAKTLTLSDGESIPYDKLIVAAGATHSYFGNDRWAEHAPGLKTLTEAIAIRRQVLLAYEAAERATDPEEVRRLLTFIVIGGGPTGVELAGALSEIAHKTMARNFRSFNPHSVRVLLIEGGDRLLLPFPEDLSAKAAKQLRHIGVDIRFGDRVTDIREGVVELGGEVIEAQTILWAAGVKASPLAELLGVTLQRGGKVPVTDRLTLEGNDDVFVIGDMTYWEQDGEIIGGVAPVAIQMANRAAKNIRAQLAGTPTEAFRYFDKGSMATIGRSKAVAVAGKIKLSGFIAWLAWLFIHIMYLVDFRNRLMVIIEWAMAYFTFQRSARIVLEDPIPPPKAAQPTTAQPTTALPEAAQPEAAQPEAAQPEAAQPESAQPEAD